MFFRILGLKRELCRDFNMQRDTAADELAGIGTPRAVKALIQCIDSGDTLIASAAANALGKVRNPSSARTLAKSLGDSNPYVRIWSSKALANIKDTGSIGALIGALRDEDNRVVTAAADALGVIAHSSDKAAIDALVAVAENQELDVADHGLSALESLGVADSISALREKRFPKLMEDYKKSEVETRRRLADKIMKYDFTFLRSRLQPNDLARLALDADIYGGFAAIKGVSLESFNSNPEIAAPPGWSEILTCLPAITTDADIEQLVGSAVSRATRPLWILIGPRCIPFLIPGLYWITSPTRINAVLLDILAEIGDDTCIAAIEDLGLKNACVSEVCKRTVERIRNRIESK